MDFKRILASAPREREPEEPATLLTPWGEAVDSARVLQEHPRPQFARASVQVLNGWWSWCVVRDADAARAWRTARPPARERFDERILVPFSPEAPLSGVGRQTRPDELLWYRRAFALPTAPARSRLLLHFEAVDHACACYCNGRLAGTHEGGYLPFAFDVTDLVHAHGENELALCVFDPSDAGAQPRGKQKLQRGGIWYTAQSGIWQSVWLEAVPARRIERADIAPDAAGERIAITAQVTEAGEALAVEVLGEDGRVVARAEAAAKATTGESAAGSTTLALTVPVSRPRLWSPDDPFLYGLHLRYGDDQVASYCAFRTVCVRPDARGVPRFHLNGEPLFLRGVLDQGYWSDGLMTAPSDEALAFDVQAMKDAGFNLLRKHIKVESDRWYYHCDRLGMLVWQDMVSGGSAYSAWHTSYKPTFFRRSWGSYDDRPAAHQASLAAGDEAFRAAWIDSCLGAVDHLKNHPCIVGWVLFNEGWGQFDARAATAAVRAADPTRPIDAVSGWYDQACGDYLSVHNYFRDLEVYPDRAAPPRAFVISEFGGISLHLPEHSALSSSYGYENYADADAWRQGVRAQLAAVDALEPQGLAGFVYTQLSDVEEETNGLLTYDRRVNKLDSTPQAGGVRAETEARDA